MLWRKPNLLRLLRRSRCVWVVAFPFFFFFMYYELTFNVYYVYKHFNVEDKCIIPRPDPFDPSVMQFVWDPAPLVCSTVPSVVHLDDDGVVQFNSTAISILGLTADKLACGYRILSRHIDDDHVNFSNLTPFVPPHFINEDFFHITCKNVEDNSLVLDKLFAGIRKTKLRESKDSATMETKDQLSVIMFGVDSISRSAGIRKIPRTIKFLKEDLKAYDFKGYMKVGENTLPNMVPLLTGRRVWTDEVPVSDFFDEFPFIWKNFSAHQYSTLYAEDMPRCGAFNQFPSKGFVAPPTDYYMRPFWLGIENLNEIHSKLSPIFLFFENRNVNIKKYSSLCYGEKPKHFVQMEYLKQYLNAYKHKKKFALSFITELAHEYPNLFAHGDNDFYEFFKWMKEDGHLENTVLVFFSDHGARIDKIRNTFVGRIEDRMPMLYIVLPDHLVQTYPNLHQRLQENTERLSTAFDLHQTLVDILNRNFKEPKTLYVNERVRGFSLFKDLPKDRSCNDAWIPQEYCACYVSKLINITESNIPELIAVDMVNSLNEVLMRLPKCSKLNLHSVTEAQVVTQGMKHFETANKGISLFQFLTPKESKDTRYLVAIETVPCHGAFEATYDVDSQMRLKRVGDIVRINKYGDQPKCINEKLVRPFCCCNDYREAS